MGLWTNGCRMASPALMRLLVPLIALCMTLESVLAIDGEYMTSPVLNNKWLPDPMEIITIVTKDECERKCKKHPLCNGYAVSTFERKCRMYDVQSGVAPVKNNGYTLYVKKKTEEEGYYTYGTMYFKLNNKRLNAKDAAKECAREKGLLAAVRNQEINNLLWQLMIRRGVWNAFIGVNDAKEEGKWIYSDTGPVSYATWDWNGMWYRKDLNCATVRNTIDGPVWRQANCWHREYFFCQIPMF